MSNNIKNPKYIEFVKTLGCCHCGTDYEIDPHHIIGVGMGKTGGKAADIHAMPLCRTHHNMVHENPTGYPQTRWMCETQESAVRVDVL